MRRLSAEGRGAADADADADAEAGDVESSCGARLGRDGCMSLAAFVMLVVVFLSLGVGCVAVSL